MPSFKRNLFSIYAVNIFNGIMGIALIPLSLQFLGAEGYGLFSIYTVIASFVALLDVGVGKSLQRALSADQSDSSYDKNIAVACGAYLLILAGLAVIFPVLIIFIPKYLFPVEPSIVNSLRWIIFFACFEYLLFIPLAINQSICFSKEEFGKHAKFSLLSGIFKYVILLGAIYIFKSVVVVVGIYVMRRILDQYLSSHILGKLPRNIWRPILRQSELKTLASHALGLSITRLLQTILMAIGSMLVNRVVGLEGLGIYRVAFDVASKVWFVSNGIGLVIYPKLVKAFVAGKAEQDVFLKLSAAMLVSWVAFMTAGLIASVASPILLLLIKVNSKEIVSLFVPLVVGVCMNAHANLGYEVIQAAGRYKMVNIINLIAIVILTALFLTLNPTFGLVSIAWAWMLSQFVYAALTDLAALVSMKIAKTSHRYSVGVRLLSLISGSVCVGVMQSNSSSVVFLGAFVIQILLLMMSLAALQKENRKLKNA